VGWVQAERPGNQGSILERGKVSRKATMGVEREGRTSAHLPSFSA